MTFADAMRKFRSNAPRFEEVDDMHERLERAMKGEYAQKCATVKDGKVCGKPVHVLENGARCVACKGCLAARLTGDLDALPL